MGLFGEPPQLKVKVSSPPVEGAANNELIQFFSKLFKCSKSSIQIIRGEHSRNKELLFSENDIKHMVDILDEVLS